jgi:hypothetical protein
MSRNKTYRIHGEQQLLLGLEKNLAKSSVIVLRGEKHTAGEITSVLQSRIDAASRVSLAKAAWLNAVEQEQTLLAQSDPLISDVRTYVEVVHGSSLDALAEFGLSPKKRQALTVDEFGGESRQDAGHARGAAYDGQAPEGARSRSFRTHDRRARRGGGGDGEWRDAW